LELNHNHPLVPTTNLYAVKNQTLPEAILWEIRFYTVEGNLSAMTQRQLLSTKFPGITIFPRNLQNQIQKYKIED